VVKYLWSDRNWPCVILGFPFVVPPFGPGSGKASTRKNVMSFEFYHFHSEQSRTIHVPAIGLQLVVSMPPNISEGAVTVLETTNAPGFGPPLHRHTETEVFRVLEGRYLFEVDGRRFEAKTGDLISVPGGAAHAFVNVTHEPAKQHILMVPGMDAERFFVDLGELFREGPPSRELLNQFGRPWGVEFLGPPIKQAS
jgi:quercetin dioxygenase-like cupin family protein